MRTDSLERRVRRLERVNLGLAAALCAAGAILVSAAVRPTDVVTATRFVLIGEDGATRAELRSTPEGTGLFILDGEGTDRASLLYNEEETAMYLRDAAGSIRVGAAQYAHGGGGFALHGEETKGATVLYMKDFRGSLRLYDREGKVTYELPPPDAGN